MRPLTLSEAVENLIRVSLTRFCGSPLECASLLSLLALYGRWNISIRTKAAASCRTPKSAVGCAVEFVAIKTATNSTNFYEKRSLPITLGLKRSH